MKNTIEPLRILVVDDEEQFRSGLRRLFYTFSEELPAEITEASSGEEAIEMLSARKFDCVLLDYMISDCLGTELLLKISPGNPHLPVIMVTGAGSEEVAVEAMKSGAADYLVKGSITPKGLQRTLMNAVEKSVMRKTMETQRQALIDAERQRVMFESLGAACHHLGQPATVITTYLSILMKDEKDAERVSMFRECVKAAESLDDILHRLQTVQEYRTEPYIPAGDDDSSKAPRTILRI